MHRRGEEPLVFQRIPLRPLRPTVGNNVGLTTRFSGRWPMNLEDRREDLEGRGCVVHREPALIRGKQVCSVHRRGVDGGLRLGLEVGG